MSPVKEQVNFIITLRAFCVADHRPIFTAPKKIEEHLENTTNLKKNRINMSWSQKYAT